MKLPAYPKYKASGVEWLGDVPEHWTPIALRRTSTRYAGGTPDRSNDSYWEDGTIPWINSGSVNQELITEPSAFITEEAYRNSSARWVAKGALVMALAGQGKTKGRVAQTGIATTCNQSMAAICPAPPTEARYLYWLLVSQYEHIRNMAGGEARDGLNLEILGSVPCLKVPPAEQCAIAEFLDRETGRIDRLVAKKRELIERLKEKRTALISRTVTQGLPPAAARAAGLPENPPLKPSGLDWLGDIPAHWEASRLGFFVTKIGSGKTPRGGAQTYQSEGVMLIRSQNVYDDGLRLEDVVFIDDKMDEDMAGSRVNAQDVLLNITGASLGRCAVVPRKFPKANVNQHVCIVRPDVRKLAPVFAQLSLTAQFVKDQIFADEVGSSREGLNFQQVRDLMIAVPPLPEQLAIAAYLDAETAKLDALVAKVETAIERLQEYRTALVTAAVTGKIDVRTCVQ